MCEAIVLAGGRGSRLHGVLPGRQKVTAPVAGRPFICMLLDQLAAAGIRRVVVCTGYRAEQVEAALAARTSRLDIVYAREATPLGTGGALRHGLERAHGDAVLVMNGDSYCAVDVRAFADFHHAARARASLVVVRVADTARFGRVELGDGDRVTRFTEKAAAPAGAGWINAGIYCFARAALTGLPVGQVLSLEREVLPGMVGAGLYAFRSPGVFLDIGTPEAYAQAEKFFASIRGTLYEP
jgi:D-glycero-alpha-D-manno-heptose 1-phosphate guanylyltransferase